MTSKKPRKQIVAMGGALAKSEPAAHALYEYVLGQTSAKRPRVLQINTATGDAPSSALFTYRALSTLSCEVSELKMFERTPKPAELRKMIVGSNVIVVGGGNTKSMLAVWRAFGIDELLFEAYEKGVVLSGSSAGGICWFDQCLTDSWAVDYTALDCLGILPGSCCPHFDGEAGRKETYHRLIEDGTLMPGIAIDERVGVHYIDGKIHRIVTTAPKIGAYNVGLRRGKILQTALAVEQLSVQ